MFSAEQEGIVKAACSYLLMAVIFLYVGWELWTLRKREKQLFSMRDDDWAFKKLDGE